MKHQTPLLLAGLLLASSLSSCVVAPVPAGPVAARSPHSHSVRHVTPVGHHARSPYSPGGRNVTPRERHAHSPRSPRSLGGSYVTPRERHPSHVHSPGGVVVLPRGARPVVHRGVRYHTHGNTWYRSSGRGYVIVARPY